MDKNNAIVEALGLRHDELREEIDTLENAIGRDSVIQNDMRRAITTHKKEKEIAEAKLTDVRLVMERMGEIFDNDVWRNVDRVYETRWDCRSGQREAA